MLLPYGEQVHRTAGHPVLLPAEQLRRGEGGENRRGTGTRSGASRESTKQLRILSPGVALAAAVGGAGEECGVELVRLVGE